MNDVFTLYASLIDRRLATREDCEKDARSLGYADVTAKIDDALRRRASLGAGGLAGEFADKPRRVR